MSNSRFWSIMAGSGVAAAVSLVLGTAAAPTPAHAQEVAKNTGELLEIVVTGSRIRRKDETSLSPVFTMDLGDIESSGIVSIGALLQELPSVGSSLNSNGTAGVSHGTSSLNLRNLGKVRTQPFRAADASGRIHRSDSIDVCAANEPPLALRLRLFPT